MDSPIERAGGSAPTAGSRSERAEMPELLTPSEVAELLRVEAPTSADDRKRLRRWLASLGVPIVKFGAQWRVRRDKLLEAIDDAEAEA